jgi:hypothetical protein
MHKTVTEFLNSNNTLADEQFGFRDSLWIDIELYWVLQMKFYMTLIKCMLVDYLVIMLKHLIV